VSETNYFFRLTRYRERLEELISTGTINIEPKSKRNEMLRYLQDLSEDLSISRSSERARGWGIPVPGDPSQIIYVWIDALANYVSAPGETRWAAFDEITHVVGKGVLRFHAIYWPAVLLSAGLRLPNNVFVHSYVTVNGRKIGKSLGNVVDPGEPIRALGLDAFRYYLLRHIGCYKDGDFSWERYRQVYEQELANQLGNLVSRVTALTRKLDALPIATMQLHPELEPRVEKHVRTFALQKALDEIWKAVDGTNAYIAAEQPWKTSGEQHASTLAIAVDAIDAIARTLAPFLPDTSQRIIDALNGRAQEILFPKKSA
jgi:methionyl-tRNA synthetase